MRHNEHVQALRLILSIVAGGGAALVAYALAYTHGNPRPSAPDPDLAFALLPLELTLGLIVGLLTYRAVGRRQRQEPRSDVAERMVLRIAHRQGGRFTLADLTARSPLTEPQARTAVRNLLDAGQLREENGTYRLP